MGARTLRRITAAVTAAVAMETMRERLSMFCVLVGEDHLPVSDQLSSYRPSEARAVGCQFEAGSWIGCEFRPEHGGLSLLHLVAMQKALNRSLKAQPRIWVSPSTHAALARLQRAPTRSTPGPSAIPSRPAPRPAPGPSPWPSPTRGKSRRPPR